jgi:hypothetical protein
MQAQRELAERVRAALIDGALAAHEDAGVRGLCAEGAWEAVLTALRKLDVEPVCRAAAQVAHANGSTDSPG